MDGDEAGPLDDAALVRTGASDRDRLVMTVDVVTPMVDHAETFGEIAAANSISDVYAMGGMPQVALSFIGFPTDKLELSVLGEIIAGMRRTCARAKTAIVGGHTIVDPEPKAGLSVTGIVRADRAWSHRRARARQVLLLTKRIGTGVIVQAMKNEQATPEQMAAAIASMSALNDVGIEAAHAAGVTSATDVTGFGLLGHLRNICEASNVSARIEASRVPLLPGVEDLIERGLVPGGTKRNLRYVQPTIDFASAVSEPLRLLLADAQTSGGLLLCVPEANASSLAQRLLSEGAQVAAIVGSLEAHSAEGPWISVLP